MKSKINSIFSRIKTEPPVAAAILTIVIFTIPVFVSIATSGVILLPAGFTSFIKVDPIYGVFALLINLALLFIFSTAPLFRLGFQSITAPDFIRKTLIFLYLFVTLFSLYMINEKLNLLSSLFDDPIVTMLKVGATLVEENLLHYYFYGICGCFAYALVQKSDGFFLKSITFIVMIVIVLFYFFIGRREISIMTLCFLFLLKRDKISRWYLILIAVLIVGVIVYILSLRVGDDSSFLFSANSEELSSVAFSSYVIERDLPNIVKSFTEATILRPYLMPLNISAAFFKAESGDTNSAVPVLGIAGVTYMYGFIIPTLTVFVMGSFFRSVTNEFKKNKKPILKLLVIYITFKSFNLFRNGEFPVVVMDTLKFFLILSPAVFLKFYGNKNLSYKVAPQLNYEE